jgi:hypothetical protein
MMNNTGSYKRDAGRVKQEYEFGDQHGVEL